MSDTKMTWGKVLMIAAVALAAVLASGQAYAQGPANGGPLPGIFPANGPGGPFVPIPGINMNDPRMNNLVGTVIGSFLGYMVENNMHNDRDNHYYHRNWDRDNRYYRRDDRRYDDWNHYRDYRRDYDDR